MPSTDPGVSPSTKLEKKIVSDNDINNDKNKDNAIDNGADSPDSKGKGEAIDSSPTGNRNVNINSISSGNTNSTTNGITNRNSPNTSNSSSHSSSGNSPPYRPLRADRMHATPTAENAQGMFPPAACIFVGNLPNKIPSERLVKELKDLFHPIGECYVKTNRDRVRDLPAAFVQFEVIQHAEKALSWQGSAYLRGRPLRIEKSKAKRTGILGFRNGDPIDRDIVQKIVFGRGPIEHCSVESISMGYGYRTVAKVTFAYVLDFQDAVRHFQNDFTFYLLVHGRDMSPPPPRLPPLPLAPYKQAPPATYYHPEAFPTTYYYPEAYPPTICHYPGMWYPPTSYNPYYPPMPHNPQPEASFLPGPSNYYSGPPAPYNPYPEAHYHPVPYNGQPEPPLPPAPNNAQPEAPFPPAPWTRAHYSGAFPQASNSNPNPYPQKLAPASDPASGQASDPAFGQAAQAASSANSAPVATPPSSGSPEKGEPLIVR